MPLPPALSKTNLGSAAQAPIEGNLVGGQAGVEVGDQIRVQLGSLNIKRGFIDFVRFDKGI